MYPLPWSISYLLQLPLLPCCTFLIFVGETGFLLQVLVKDLQKAIRKTRYFGLSFDDSKAIDDSEFMSTEAYYVDLQTGNQVSAFLMLKEVTDVDAANLTQKLVSWPDCLIDIVDCLDCLTDLDNGGFLTCCSCIDNLDHEIYLHFMAKLQLEAVEEILDMKPADLHKHLVGVASDGASVCVGIRHGICARLRDGYVPHLDNVHCLAHVVQVRLLLYWAAVAKESPFNEKWPSPIS